MHITEYNNVAVKMDDKEYVKNNNNYYWCNIRRRKISLKSVKRNIAANGVSVRDQSPSISS